MFGKIMGVGAVGAAVLLAATGGANAAERSSCSTSGLVATRAYRVTSLHASGVSCSKARSVAQEVADELMHGKPISVAGIEGLALATSSCTGCRTATQVSLSYPGGKVTISLGGKQPAPPSLVSSSGPLVSA